jgi:competence protein ComEC
MRQAKVSNINTLHITSWDEDHCCTEELNIILDVLKPHRIEYPGYKPDSDNGTNSLRLIRNYIQNYNQTIGIPVSDIYIKSLDCAQCSRRNDVLYNPIVIREKHNDNSIVQLFRYGRFTVLSLGDCESQDIARDIMSDVIARTEVDVLILAHHGADNGFTTRNFLKTINPRVAICTTDRGNQYNHPHPNIRQMLYDCNIPLYTTKDGDVLVTCSEDNICHVYNMISNNQSILNEISFSPKYILPA